MELYKLNLPNGIVNNIIEYNCDDDECDYCSIWRYVQDIIKSLCRINIMHKRNVEEDILAFVIVYYEYLPPLKDVKQVMRISEKKYEVLKHIFGLLAYEKVEDVKENIKLYIESKQINVKKYNKGFKYFCKINL
jgi:GTPase